LKKIVIILIVIISVIFGIYMINKNNYVHSEAVFVSTDTLTNIAFKIDGKIKVMTKEEGELVKKGELLATLYTKTLKAKLKEIEYKIKGLKNKLLSLKIEKEKLYKALELKKRNGENNIKNLQVKINSLKYQIKANEAKLVKLEYDKNNFYKLYKNKKISFDSYQKVKTEYEYLFNMIKSQKENLKALDIALDITQNNLQSINNEFKSIDILEENIKSLTNNIASLNEIKIQLLIKLNDSNLTAPFDGVIAKKFVNPATVVKKGTFIYSIVNPKNIYIKVLLSEKKLAGIKIGSKAVITLDAFKNKEYKGIVYQIMPVSASTFSLVPRDIASGEFTKLDQRFIVKIRLNQYDPNMRIGMGGEVKIYKDNK